MSKSSKEIENKLKGQSIEDFFGAIVDEYKIKPVFEAISAFLKNINKSIPDFEKFSKSINGLKFFDGISNAFKALNNFNYFCVLNDIEWPLFLRSDFDIMNTVLRKRDLPKNQLSSIICEYYDSDKINDILESWRHFLVEDKERFNIFKEAVDLHNKGLYYGSTALLMTQSFGIISDSYSDTELSKIAVPEDSINDLCKYYGINFDNHNRAIKNSSSEKQKLIELVCFTERELFWAMIIKYLYKVVFSRGSNNFGENNPLRNKICHGEQLNFGTKEKSLKAILIIDLLLILKNEINIYLKANKKSEI